MEANVVRLSSKGQLTLPAEIRRKLGLEKGARLLVLLEHNEIRIRKLNEGRPPAFTFESPFFDLIGSFSGPEDLAENHDRYLAED
ncbi:MAG: AbrB/MazE/SpoVT family DNA-binding domain-containing protein [Clostridia bacterium]|jgi:AbrB family looped-hinge helix DNA binding protein|nr:AbrB/MazE/SpoVT family DNA-binding domain-containing protein [Clostridia bacterium]MDH7572275.1 AbrB/MazE/SpoVT family DNA-binding domain-containing protein [Clostridia bacterium]